MLTNSVTCLTCGVTITSRYRWDFQSCACDGDTRVSVDGGHDYLRRAYGVKATWREADGTLRHGDESSAPAAAHEAATAPFEGRRAPAVCGHEILRGVVGSTAHGLNVEDGLEDRDEMGITIEPIERVVGFEPFDHLTYRTAVEREGRQDARSRAGDLDLVVYSLRKYLRLALGGNPTLLTLLFLPESLCVTLTDEGRELRALAPKIVSRQSGHAFLGYLRTQRDRLLGVRGQKRINRPELVQRYGYDTKYASHILRLALQGIELMSCGRLTLPLADPHRAWLRGVRTGAMKLHDVLARASALEADLQTAIEDSPLPNAPDTRPVEAWAASTYLTAWAGTRWGDLVMSTS